MTVLIVRQANHNDADPPVATDLISLHGNNVINKGRNSQTILNSISVWSAISIQWKYRDSLKLTTMHSGMMMTHSMSATQ